MYYKTTDLFGNEVDGLPNDKAFQKSRKTPTMQQLFGIAKGKQCKNCQHCVKNVHGIKAWYKCEIWNNCFKGQSSASDIRISAQACGRYRESD